MELNKIDLNIHYSHKMKQLLRTFKKQKEESQLKR